MIRAVTAGGLLTLLALVLYLPSAYPPDRFVRHLHAEHELNGHLLGSQPTLRILDRMRFLQGHSASVNPIPSTFLENPAPTRVDLTVARHVSAASARLFESEYFKSIEALFALSLYRVSSLLEWLPLLSMFLLAAVIDGLIRRVVKSKEFLQHNPELFAVHLSLVVLTGCALVVAFVVPMTVHPFAFALAPLLASLFFNQAIGNFHSRG